jgi:hypothetical protein
MSMGYYFRRFFIEQRLRKAIGAAEYCKQIRREAERSVAHHELRADQLLIELAELDHRADLARLGGGA